LVIVGGIFPPSDRLEPFRHGKGTTGIRAVLQVEPEAPDGHSMAPTTYHVVPAEDWVGHEEVQDRCVCGPHVEYFPRGKVIVHHALDGRHRDDEGWVRRRALEVAEERALTER
jgi:hypothetical protein